MSSTAAPLQIEYRPPAPHSNDGSHGGSSYRAPAPHSNDGSHGGSSYRSPSPNAEHLIPPSNMIILTKPRDDDTSNNTYMNCARMFIGLVAMVFFGFLTCLIGFVATNNDIEGWLIALAVFTALIVSAFCTVIGWWCYNDCCKSRTTFSDAENTV
jgi:hypothetical protein